MTFKVADLCDDYEDKLQILQPGMRDYGGNIKFSGHIVTLKLFEDNSLVREAVSEPGNGRVLVVDGGGSMRCALLGDILAGKAMANDWAGLIIYGCIRDSDDISKMSLGVKALDVMPLKSVKKGIGERDVPVTFMGVTFNPGEYVYCDHDGVVTSTDNLCCKED